MANFACIAAAGLSLERLINVCYAEANPIPGSATRPKAVLIRTEDFVSPGTPASLILPPSLSIFLYRVDFSKEMRAGWSAVGSVTGQAHLPLELHFLLTPWAANPEHELLLLGRAMQCLEEHASLSGPLLVASGGWTPAESVQVMLEEISTEAVMRTFDSLPHDYKLSVPYVARVVRLDGLAASPPADVLTAITGALPGAP